MMHQAVRRRLSACAAGLATMAMALGFAAVPAQAAPPPTADYVALGDSFAAGQGAVPYTDQNCFVSRKGYPEIADNRRDIKLTTNAGCSGHLIKDVVADAHASVGSDTKIVTVTVGGNDLGTTEVLMVCLPAPESVECGRAAATVRTKLESDSFALSLAEVVAAIRTKSPTAKVVFTGYPRLFAPGHPFAAVANPLADGLNRVISGVADATGSDFVDVSGAFAAHGIGSAEPWINFSAAGIQDPANFHPNGEGYRHGYYASLVGQNAFDLSLN
ncbi:SGNH/GDSL hydrolase family protein [Pseudarthrobacter sulfonivorans]|uniref:SGNH/GDSL hydrolase family protein n=1 Tax=Pseudarthrobacter sulfonivorans TaxID=121292 RepID=UPI002860C393|nr:SGNH/GDSL hydrolase family protein [Pseudarthrobacter sulfonivorans]MDR6414977.1 lysophospholipase L1-like esterase [Pseudarthrobacter sulfonivorans]